MNRTWHACVHHWQQSFKESLSHTDSTVVSLDILVMCILFSSDSLFLFLCVFISEPSIFGWKQVASAGHDGGVFRQWLRIPLPCCQTSAAEEVKWLWVPCSLLGNSRWSVIECSRTRQEPLAVSWHEFELRSRETMTSITVCYCWFYRRPQTNDWCLCGDSYKCHAS